MARPLRIAVPNAWQHVMNRGLARRAVFGDDDDRQGFLDLLTQCGRRWDVWAGAVVLLPNHYHVVLHDRRGNLSRAMRHLDGVYTQRFNRRHNRDGPLMRGRFRSRLVQEERYLLEVVRYVHSNPVRAGLVARAGDYPWSSHRHYLSRRKPPQWLRTDLVVDAVGEQVTQRGWFDRFVHERVESKLARVVGGPGWSAVLGDEDFVKRVRRKVQGRREWRVAEVPEGRRMAALTVDEIVTVAQQVFGVSREDLVRGRRGQSNVARQATLLMCREQTATSSAQLAELLGVCESTATGLVVRFRQRVKSDREAQRAWSRLAAAVGRIVQTGT